MRIRPTLSFRDGQLEGFDKLMKAPRPATSATAEVTLTQDAPNEELRGKKVDVEFEVLEVKKLKLPELTADFLQEIGGFETEDELRDAIRKNLQRQLEYQQQQNARQQITAAADQEAPIGSCRRACWSGKALASWNGP